MRLARCEGFVGVVCGGLVTPIGPDDQDFLLQVAMARRPPPPAGDPLPLGSVRLRAPIPRPASVRDFYAFEGHVRTARRLRGLEMDPDWYVLPVFYFSNPAVTYGPEDEIPYPSSTSQLDYELEFAWVLGEGGSDLDPRRAEELVAGYMVFNDFSARDVQRREMKLSLGPAKGKDFANAFGPVLVTPDEWSPAAGHAMVARVNGAEWSRGRTDATQFSVGEMIAYASRDSVLRRGDVMGSGTCEGGCILELAGVHGPERYPWLRPGDVVELEIEGIGVLRNRIGPPRRPRPPRS